MAGLIGGILVHGSADAPVVTITEWVAPIGEIWIALLRMTVVPLVITQMFIAVLGSPGRGSLAALSGKALLLFVGMMLVAQLFTLVAAPPLIALFQADPLAAASLKAGTLVPEAARAASQSLPSSLGAWLVDLIPSNIVQAATGSDILPLLIFTILFAMAAGRLAMDQRDLLLRIGQALAEATMTLVRWLLAVTPLGVFSLTFVMAAKAGIGVAGFMGAFVLIVCGLMVAFTILLYPFTSLLGAVSLSRFARALAPAQLVAATTRSSIAALPALVEGARDTLGLPASATGFVLPFAISAFKVNQGISATAKLLFVAHVFGIPLSAGAIATFLVTIIITGFSRAGVPGGGVAFRNLPAYLAAGLPIEGIVILEAVDTIPDIFKTVTNVTGDMSVAAILSRRERAGVSA